MTSNAVRIFKLPLECESNATRTQLEGHDQNARMSRIHLECISTAGGIYFDIFGTKRIQLECTSYSSAFQLDSFSNQVSYMVVKWNRSELNTI